MGEKFDVIVVGGGLGGLTAAFHLAKKGVNAVVLEKGEYTGAKNVTGGIIVGRKDTKYNIDDVISNFLEQAPLERKMTKCFMHMMSEKSKITTNITSYITGNKYAYSVLRAKLDKWLGDIVNEELSKNGGGVLPAVTVSDITREGETITGVKTSEGEEINCNLIIAADGVNSVVAKKTGLTKNIPETKECMHGCKEVIKLPKEEIEKRFNIKGNEGETHLFAGSITKGVSGGGFLYTNSDSISVGAMYKINSLVESGTEPFMLQDIMLEHSMIKNLLKDGEVVEYSAHNVPDGMKCAMEKPYANGVMAVGDAAGFMFALTYKIEGMNMAVASGAMAAEAAIRALEKKDFTEKTLSFYHNLLKNSFVCKELFGFNRFLSKIVSRKLFYSTVPSMMGKLGKKISSDVLVKKMTVTDRTALLSYNPDDEHPHIKIVKDVPELRQPLVKGCPAGCYSIEKAKDEQGNMKDVLILNTLPCVECGNCMVIGRDAIDWNHPRGGMGVKFKYG